MGLPDVKKAQHMLALKRAELEQLSKISADARSPVKLDQQSVGRVSRMDAMQQQAMNRATEAKRAADLVRIEAAERRIRDGDYGFCEECGEEVPSARLEIDPMAEKCVHCA